VGSRSRRRLGGACFALGELRELLREEDPALRCLCLTLDDLGLQLLGESAHPRWRKLDPPIQTLHERLGVTGEDVGLAASRGRRTPLPEAIEIQVAPFASVSDSRRPHSPQNSSPFR
jgi:hypothetical protein